MRRVPATIVAVEINNYDVFWVYAFSFSYAACNAHGPYCHLGLCGYKLFSTLSHKRHDFRKVSEHKKSVL